MIILAIHNSHHYCVVSREDTYSDMSGCITAEELKFVLTHLPGKVSQAPSVLPNIVHGGGFR